MKHRVSILGSTGSIGRQSLDVVRKLGYGVTAITACNNIKLLEEQIREFSPELAVVCNEKAAAELRIKVADTSTKVLGGEKALVDAAASDKDDLVITAVVGTVGLKPTLEAIHQKKRIALANKETLVCAGHIVMQEAVRSGAEILPVDSEHSAIFQCLMAGQSRELKRIFLTASGGPFRGRKTEELINVRKEQALCHPNWSMGAKITIDSATLMNKGLEFIEAMHLFNVRPEQINILVHPQSVVHSMVEFKDNSVIAQLGVPDMRLPIELALTYPKREDAVVSELDFTKISALTFEKPDENTFKCLGLAKELAGRRDVSCAVMNAANEAAVKMFLEDKIGFLDIYELIRDAVDKFGSNRADTLDDILEADSASRRYVFGKA